MQKYNCKLKLASILFNKRDDINVLLIFAAVLVALGFFFEPSVNSNYTAMELIISRKGWSLIFLGYALFKAAVVFIRIPFFIVSINSAVGLWIWSYVLLSFTVFDSAPFSAVECMLVIPVLAEVWALAYLLYHRGQIWR